MCAWIAVEEVTLLLGLDVWRHQQQLVVARVPGPPQLLVVPEQLVVLPHLPVQQQQLVAVPLVKQLLLVTVTVPHLPVPQLLLVAIAVPRVRVQRQVHFHVHIHWLVFGCLVLLLLVFLSLWPTLLFLLLLLSGGRRFNASLLLWSRFDALQISKKKIYFFNILIFSFF
jgi:hypothetical protein